MIRRRAADALSLALLVLIAVGTGHLFLTTALAAPDIAAQAEAMKGM
jgi:uridylate kinase